MVLSLEKESITKKTDQSWQTISVRRQIAAPRPELLYATGLAHTSQDGSTLSAQIQTWLRGEAHLTLAGRRQDQERHYLLLLPFLPDLLHSIFSGWYFSNTFWDNLLPGRLVPFHWLRHLLFSVGSCTAFRDEWYSRWKRRATLWLHAWPSLLKHGRKKKKLKHFRKR